MTTDDTQPGRPGTDPVRLRVVRSTHPWRPGLLSLRMPLSDDATDWCRALVIAGYRPGDIVELRLVTP